MKLIPKSTIARIVVYPLYFFFAFIILTIVLGLSGALDEPKVAASAKPKVAASAKPAVAVVAPTDGGGARIYPATVDRYAVIDPATIGVAFTVHNDGSKAVSPSCTVRLQNSGGAYHGFDIFSMNTQYMAL